MGANQSICFFLVFYVLKAHPEQFTFVKGTFFNKKWNQVFALLHKNRFHFSKKFGFVRIKFYEQFPLKAVFFNDFAQVEAILLLHRIKKIILLPWLLQPLWLPLLLLRESLSLLQQELRLLLLRLRELLRQLLLRLLLLLLLLLQRVLRQLLFRRRVCHLLLFRRQVFQLLPSLLLRKVLLFCDRSILSWFPTTH